jgi:hypothetical protein
MNILLTSKIIIFVSLLSIAALVLHANDTNFDIKELPAAHPWSNNFKSQVIDTCRRIVLFKMGHRSLPFCSCVAYKMEKSSMFKHLNQTNYTYDSLYESIVSAKYSLAFEIELDCSPIIVI